MLLIPQNSYDMHKTRTGLFFFSIVFQHIIFVCLFACWLTFNAIASTSGPAAHFVKVPKLKAVAKSNDNLMITELSYAAVCF